MFRTVYVVLCSLDSCLVVTCMSLRVAINLHTFLLTVEGVGGACVNFAGSRVPTGQGKLENVREFEWSGKVRENAKVTGKSGRYKIRNGTAERSE